MGACIFNRPVWADESFVPEGMPQTPHDQQAKKNVATQKTNSKQTKEYNLTPKMRIDPGGDTQSKGMDITNFKAFLRFGILMPEPCFLKLPRVSYAQDAHILSADRDLIYSTNVEGNTGDTVAIYRTGKNYSDPKTKEFLGYFAFKSAEAQILEKQNAEKKNNVVLQVKHNLESIDKSMRITKEESPNILSMHYLKPVLLDRQVDGYIIDVWDPGISLIGPNAAVVLSVGKRDGVSVGSLLEIYRRKDPLDSEVNKRGNNKDRPEIRVGRVLVYQVYDKLSVGLISEVYEKVLLSDKVRGEVLGSGEDPCAAQTLDMHFFDNTCNGVDDCTEVDKNNLSKKNVE